MIHKRKMTACVAAVAVLALCTGVAFASGAAVKRLLECRRTAARGGIGR